ncbi:MAG: sodium-dependent bicarbonate transport family permease, partial [Chitinophagaceae bacterium]|nr:sodium-dependent bicarbonate transport family permease [Chitinophagaceae bacterium]
MMKSNLEIPAPSIKFISLYLLFSIGFKGGQELEHSHFTSEIGYSLIFGVIIAAIIPIYTFFLAKNKVGISNAG